VFLIKAKAFLVHTENACVGMAVRLHSFFNFELPVGEMIGVAVTPQRKNTLYLLNTTLRGLGEPVGAVGGKEKLLVPARSRTTQHLGYPAWVS